MMTDNRTTERIDHPPRVREAIDELMREKDATDNRTTELLCKLLEERGVSCPTHYLHVSWCVGPKLYDAVDNIDGTLTVSSLTPEQAVAATLGSEREAELVRAMEDVLRHSTDTVWVGEAETLVDRMVSLGVYGHEVYGGVRPWEVGE